MASKKLPKKINVSIIGGEKKKEKKSPPPKKSSGKLAKIAQEALKDVKTDDRFHQRINRYNYKKGSPKNKKLMNHDVPQGQEKKAFWLWISVGITLFIIFFLWVGTLFYLDFFKVERNGLEETNLNIITDDIKKSYSDFTDSLGDIGNQLDSIKDEVNNQGDTQEVVEPQEPEVKEEVVSPDDILQAPGLEVQN